MDRTMKNLIFLLPLFMNGCSSPYYGYVPVKGDYKTPNCILKAPDGLPVLAICGKEQAI